MGSISDNICNRVQKFIGDRHLLPRPSDPELTVVVGLSGGSDSVALAHILGRLGYRLHLTHCHFGLRGAEADRDRDFCCDYAHRFALPIEVIHFDTPAYMAEHHLSAEMACRELRYDWWQTTFAPADHPGVRLCVGHHQDDAIETLLLNLMRGTGIQGLQGIPARNGWIVRPLLCLGRNDILDYLHDNRLDYVTDSTNQESIYLRNKVRNRLLPLMTEINANCLNGILETMDHLADTLYFANEGIDRLVADHVKCTSHDGYRYWSIDMDRLCGEHTQALVYAFLRPRAELSKPQLADVVACVTERRKNRIFQTDDVWICTTEAELIVAASPHFDLDPIRWTPGDVTADSRLKYFTFSRLDAGQVDPRTGHREQAFLDADKLSYPLTFRRRRQGDLMRPFGMKGRKLVSDLFSDGHYSPLQKALTWIVCDATGSIVWVSGCRPSQDFCIDASTRKVLVIDHHPADAPTAL